MKEVKLCSCKKPAIPQLFGKVIVLGAGDTAMDCATTAIRCGAEKVTLCFRRGFSEMRVYKLLFYCN
jgi:dihydropyrimidine dehydrogenase (NADP+)